ncbi:hypothetical protein M3Y95_01196100 [Aphelenchoides besseyi]|nr:hypothetical protein M3Y95_01196100 [Aphelenchoides besseyi]
MLIRAVERMPNGLELFTYNGDGVYCISIWRLFLFNLSNVKIEAEKICHDYCGIVMYGKNGRAMRPLSMINYNGTTTSVAIQRTAAYLSCGLGDTQLEASHLCARGFCLRPEHLYFETHEANKKRDVCKSRSSNCILDCPCVPRCILVDAEGRPATCSLHPNGCLSADRTRTTDDFFAQLDFKLMALGRQIAKFSEEDLERLGAVIQRYRPDGLEIMSRHNAFLSCSASKTNNVPSTSGVQSSNSVSKTIIVPSTVDLPTSNQSTSTVDVPPSATSVPNPSNVPTAVTVQSTETQRLNQNSKPRVRSSTRQLSSKNDVHTAAVVVPPSRRVLQSTT